MAGYLLTEAAKRQVEDILLESAKAYGADAASRYALLITTSLEFIGTTPELPGSTPISRLPEVRAYATRLSRLKIFGLVHDRMVLSRAARKLVGKATDL